jgi:transcriptional regulator with XRE-family HTH domain
MTNMLSARDVGFRHGGIVPQAVRCRQPLSVSNDLYRYWVPTSDPKTYLWENIVALMGGVTSLDLIAEKTKAGRGSIQRIKERQASPRLDTLELVAKAFDIEVWQLLTPNLSAGPSLTPRTMRAAQIMDKLSSDKRQLAYTMIQSLNLPDKNAFTLDEGLDSPLAPPTEQRDKAQ